MSDETLEARVAKLESVTSSYRLAVARMEHLQRERRYRLLQAAATIYAGGQHSVNQGFGEAAYMSNWHNSKTAVDEAEALLAEIEKRENAEAKS